MNQQQSDRGNRAASIEAKVAKLKEMTARNEADNVKHTAQIKDLEVDVKETAAKCVEVEGRLEGAMLQHQTLLQTHRDLALHMTNQDTDITRANERLFALQSELNAVEKRKEESNARLASVVEMNESYKSKLHILTQLEQELNIRKEKQAELDRLNAAVKEEVREVNVNITQLNTDIHISNEANTRLEAENEDLRRQVQEVEEAIASGESEEVMSRRIHETQTECDQLDREIAYVTHTIYICTH